MKSRTRKKKFRNFAAIGLVLLTGDVTDAQRNAPPKPWVATWAASPQSSAPDPEEPLLNLEDQTVRERVRVSVGGAELRIRLSNEYGSAPLSVGAVTVATPSDPASVKAGSVQSVTFGRNKTVTIPAGAPVLSDPVAFRVADGAEISISIYLPKQATTPTAHWLALKRAVISPRGDHTRDENIEGETVTKSLILVSAVLVPATAAQRLVVAFGDSVTDGDGSSLDVDRNWPSELAQRLRASPKGARVAVVNEGIAGNRLLDDCFLVKIGCFGVSALARFDRDALSLPAVTHIVVLEGINDLGFPGANIEGEVLGDGATARSADDLVGAYRQLIARAHARGVKVIGATITPFEGVTIPGYYTDAKEAVRQTVNQWIRTSGAFDAVIDFDAALRDPEHPTRLYARFASKDHLHPNDEGYRAMAEAIDLTIFQ